MELTKVEKKPIKRSVKIEGQELVYFAKESVLKSPGFFQDLKNFESEKDFDGIAKSLAAAITEWNMEENKLPYPPTFENIRVLDTEIVLVPILEDITKVFTDAEKRHKKS